MAGSVLTTPTDEDLAGERLMLAFDGLRLPPAIAARLRDRPIAGVSLFRYSNVETPGQVRELTEAIQRAAGEGPTGAAPLLVAGDQEGGQLVGLGSGTTPFPGAMAVGATADPDLAKRVGRAIGLELRAMGVTVDYAPVCDLATNPANVAIGTRSFGSDPGAVGELVAGTVRGLQSAGVVATPKHFPGLGEAGSDSHHGLPIVDRSAADETSELAPFEAALEAGALAVMSAHVGLPAVTERADLPATLSRAVMTGLLRGRLGFDGLAISDALDMRALAQGPEQALDVVAALRAGIDLLLCAPDPAARERIEASVRHAAARGLLDRPSLAASAARLARVRDWLSGFESPDLSVVGSRAHAALAAEVAARSITLVRDEDRLLPLRPPAGSRVVVVEPRPEDLTPADTSSTLEPGLAAAIRVHHPTAEGFVVEPDPAAADVAALRDAVLGADVLIVGTAAAHVRPGQPALTRALLGLGLPTVTVALRGPWDLATYQDAGTHLCTYGITAPSLAACADALFGRASIEGRLPVSIDDTAPRGHGLRTEAIGR